MTDQKRDPEADGPEGAADPEPAADVAVAGADDGAAAVADATEPVMPAGTASDDVDADPREDVAASTVGGAAAAGRARTKGAPAKAAVPSVADDAVHVTDKVSAYFVIATVGVFVLIFAWALLLGSNGPISDTFATPKPIPTPAPSVVVSAEPSVEASIEPSVAPSTEPSVEASVEPSVAPSVEPDSPSPSAS